MLFNRSSKYTCIAFSALFLAVCLFQACVAMESREPQQNAEAEDITNRYLVMASDPSSPIEDEILNIVAHALGPQATLTITNTHQNLVNSPDFTIDSTHLNEMRSSIVALMDKVRSFGDKLNPVLICGMDTFNKLKKIDADGNTYMAPIKHITEAMNPINALLMILNENLKIINDHIQIGGRKVSRPIEGSMGSISFFIKIGNKPCYASIKSLMLVIAQIKAVEDLATNESMRYHKLHNESKRDKHPADLAHKFVKKILSALDADFNDLSHQLERYAESFRVAKCPDNTVIINVARQ